MILVWLDGGTVDYVSDRYRFDGAHHAPQPMQARVPFVVGSAGEKKGLLIVARHADIWQMWGPGDLYYVALFQHKRTVLQTHCRDDRARPGDHRAHRMGGKLVIRATPEAARSAFEEQVASTAGPDPIQTETAWTGDVTGGGPGAARIPRRLRPRASARRSRRRSTSRPWSGWRARSAPSSTRGSPGGLAPDAAVAPDERVPRHGAGHDRARRWRSSTVWWLAVAASWPPPPRCPCCRR